MIREFGARLGNPGVNAFPIRMLAVVFMIVDHFAAALVGTAILLFHIAGNRLGDKLRPKPVAFLFCLLIGKLLIIEAVEVIFFTLMVNSVKMA